MENSSYDEKLSRILRGAAAVFADKGYHNASIRDISGITEVSLSGLYYYFNSKEELLFLIESHCFDTILQRLQESLDGVRDPEERIRIVIRNHLRFFVNNMREMKVLSHEADALTGEYRERVTDQKRRYTEIVADTIRKLLPGGSDVDLRVATFSLFGMMNWIYTWYRPERDVPVEVLADDMTRVFLGGLMAPGSRTTVPDDDAEEADTSIWRAP